MGRGAPAHFGPARLARPAVGGRDLCGRAAAGQARVRGPAGEQGLRRHLRRRTRRRPTSPRRCPLAGALLPKYYATGHLSLDNYIAMVSGQAPELARPRPTARSSPSFTPGTVRRRRAGHRHRLRLPGRASRPSPTSSTAKGLTLAGLHGGHGRRAEAEQDLPRTRRSAPRRHPRRPRRSATSTPPATTRSSTSTRSSTGRAASANDVDLRPPAGRPALAAHDPELRVHHARPLQRRPRRDRASTARPGGLPRRRRVPAHVDPEDPRLARLPRRRPAGRHLRRGRGLRTNADSSACCGERPGPNTPNPGFATPGPGGGRIGAVLISPFITPGHRDTTRPTTTTASCARSRTCSASPTSASPGRRAYGPSAARSSTACRACS